MTTNSSPEFPPGTALRNYFDSLGTPTPDELRAMRELKEQDDARFRAIGDYFDSLADTDIAPSARKAGVWHAIQLDYRLRGVTYRAGYRARATDFAPDETSEKVFTSRVLTSRYLESIERQGGYTVWVDVWDDDQHVFGADSSADFLHRACPMGPLTEEGDLS